MSVSENNKMILGIIQENGSIVINKQPLKMLKLFTFDILFSYSQSSKITICSHSNLQSMTNSIPISPRVYHPSLHHDYLSLPIHNKNIRQYCKSDSISKSQELEQDTHLNYQITHCKILIPITRRSFQQLIHQQIIKVLCWLSNSISIPKSKEHKLQVQALLNELQLHKNLQNLLNSQMPFTWKKGQNYYRVLCGKSKCYVMGKDLIAFTKLISIDQSHDTLEAIQQLKLRNAYNFCKQVFKQQFIDKAFIQSSQSNIDTFYDSIMRQIKQFHKNLVNRVRMKNSEQAHQYSFANLKKQLNKMIQDVSTTTFHDEQYDVLVDEAVSECFRNKYKQIFNGNPQVEIPKKLNKLTKQFCQYMGFDKKVSQFTKILCQTAIHELENYYNKQSLSCRSQLQILSALQQKTTKRSVQIQTIQPMLISDKAQQIEKLKAIINQQNKRISQLEKNCDNRQSTHLKLYKRNEDKKKIIPKVTQPKFTLRNISSTNQLHKYYHAEKIDRSSRTQKSQESISIDAIYQEPQLSIQKHINNNSMINSQKPKKRQTDEVNGQKKADIKKIYIGYRNNNRKSIANNTPQLEENKQLIKNNRIRENASRNSLASITNISNKSIAKNSSKNLLQKQVSPSKSKKKLPNHKSNMSNLTSKENSKSKPHGPTNKENKQQSTHVSNQKIVTKKK